MESDPVSPPQVSFLAVLVYGFRDNPNRRDVTSRVFRASHPEIAYQLAVQHGSVPSYGEQFIGLAALEPDVEETSPLSCISMGSPDQNVGPKDQLSAFQDPRWKGVCHSPEELAEALRPVLLLIDLPGLDEVPWSTLHHAYGTAEDIPVHLLRLVSSKAEIRKSAMGYLDSSIYHQGSTFSSTAPAIRFLIQIACEDVPHRKEVLNFINFIADTCVKDEADAIQKVNSWIQNQVRFYRQINLAYSPPTPHEIEAMIRVETTIRNAFLEIESKLKSLMEDSDRGVRKLAARIAEKIGFESSGR